MITHRDFSTKVEICTQVIGCSGFFDFQGTDSNEEGGDLVGDKMEV